MSKLAKAAGGLILITILVKIVGFGRELILSNYYGVTNYADVYITAMNIPSVIFACLGAAISTSVIPMYTKISKESGEKEAIKFSNNLINITIILCTVLLILGFIFTNEIVKVFAMGYSGEKFRLTVDFTRILLIGMIFTGINYIISSFLQIKENFIIPGIISLPYSIVIMISIILSYKMNNIYILAWGTLFAIIIQPIVQLPYAYKYGFKYRPIINLKDKNIKRLIILIIPVLIGVSVGQVNSLVDKTLASTLGEGIVAAFNYGNKLYYFVQALFITSITTVIYPMMANLLGNDDMSGFKKTLSNSINIIVLLVVPISIGAIVMSTPIVKLLFERGQFDLNATIITANILRCYAIGMVAFGVNDVISRAFYSLGDTKTPMINGAIVMVVNIVLNIVLMKMLGYQGLAIASSISAFIGITIAFITIQKKIGSYGLKSIINVSVKSLVASLVMGIITTIVYNVISGVISQSFLGLVFTLGISVLSGASIYFIIIYLFKIEEVSMITDIFKSKIKK